MYQSIARTPSSQRAFGACLLSFMILIAPMASVGAATRRATAPPVTVIKEADTRSGGESRETTNQPSLLRRFASFLLAPLPPVITATMTDSYPAHPSGKAEPGDTISYTANISNGSGVDPAAGVAFDVTLDPNTTYVPGSLKVSPLAIADAYSVAQNTPLNQPALTGVLANDTGTPAPTAVPIAAGATTQSGTVTLNADGSFTYIPPNGFTGTDTFTYTAINGYAPPNVTDAQAIVTITVNPPNTAPVANDDAASATEAGGTANGTPGTNPSGNLVTGVGAGSVADTDTEDASSALTVVQVHTGPEGGSTGTGTVGSPLAGTYGSLTLNSNGSYTYTVDNNNATVQALRTSGNTIQDIFNYTIQDTGPGPLQDTATFTVTIAGANDSPTDIAITASSVAENAAINTVVGDFSTTDIDSGDTFTYTLVAGAGSTDNASFNILGNQLRTSAAFNFETTPSLSIRVRSTDAGGLFFEEQFTITVTNVNEAPTDIALSSNTIGENMAINTVIGNFSTTDSDAGDTFTYTLVTGTGDTDNASFNINGNQLRSSIIFDFETKSSYSIRVRSTDAGSLNFEKQFTITIVNNNDAPTDIALSNSSVAENSAINTVVGNFSTTDQDAGNTFTYTLVTGTGDTDNASFNISGAQLRTSASFDFETKNSYTIRVRSTDNAAGFFEEQFTITVTDVAEAPVLTTSVGSAGFTEDGPAIAVDAGILVTDQDSPTLTSATVQITGNLQTTQDVLAFTNDGSTMGNIIAAPYVPATGLLTLTSAGSSATLLEWQNALRAVTYNNTSQNPNTTARTVTFRVTDPGLLNSNLATRGVTVTAVNDAPVLAAIEGSALAYTENDPATSITSSITVADVDSTTLTSATITISSNFQSGQDVLSFVNVPATMGNVAIQSNTGGVLTLTSAGATATLAQWQAALRAVKYNNSSDDPSTLTRTVTFQVNDGGAVNNLSNTQTRNIAITAVNDAPTANGFAGLPAQAGIPISYPIGKLGGTDVEAGTTVTVDTAAINVTNGRVTLNADGSFVFTPLPNATTASFQYRVFDNGNPPPGVNSAYVTVSFTVAGPAIYFVKNAAVGFADCTLGNECLLATAVTNIGAATNTRIFLEDANSHLGAVPLNSGGWLIGQGVTGTTFDALFSIGAPAQGTLAARPSLGLARPTVQNTVTLNTNASVRGLNISSTTNTGMADPLASISGVAVSEVAVTTTTATALLLSNETSGTFSFTGLTTTGGAGLALTGTNTSSTFTFYSVVVSSGANAAFSATGGGTIAVCDENPCIPAATGALVNTLTSTTGTALNVDNTTISTNKLEFKSISSNGAPNGIVLINTGATGGLTVNGDGSNTSVGGNATGGTITSATGADGAVAGNGVYMSNAHNVTLRRMTINGTNQNHGIRGISSTNFAMEYVTVNGTNGTSTALDEGSVNFDNLTGTASITSCLIEGGLEENLNVVNTTGTLNRLTITGTTFGFNSSASGNNNILIESQNSGTTLNFTLQSSIIKGARADWINASNNSSSVMDAVIGGSTPALGNTFDNLAANAHPTAAAGGNRVVFGAVGVLTVDIRNNTMKGSKGEAVRVRSTATGALTGTVDARVRNNTIGVAGTANSGSSEGSGIFIFVDGGADADVAITNNSIFQYNNHAIRMDVGDQINPTSVFNATVTGNTANTPGSINTDFNGIQLNNGTVGTDNFTSCVDIGGSGLQNVMTGSGDGAIFPNNAEIRVRQRQDTTVRLPGYGGANNDDAAVQSYLLGRNTATTAAASNTVGTGGGGFIGGAACTQPSFAMVAPQRDENRERLALATDLLQDSGHSNDAGSLSGWVGSVTSSLVLFVNSVDSLIMPTAQAETEKTEARDQGSQFSSQRSEVRSQKSEIRSSRAKSPDKMLSHHAISKQKAQVAHALTTTSSMLPAAPPFPISIGTIPAGKSVRITFQVTLNTLVPPSTTQVSAQGTVSGSNFSNVLTDDSDTGAADDPTVTPVIGPAVANDDPSYTAFKNTPLNITAPGVLANDSINTGAITSYGVAGTEQTTIGSPTPTAQGGTVSLNADGSGSFSYTPAAAFLGADTFIYTVTNTAVGGTDTATVTITVSDALYLNEILFNPNGTDAPNEYLEFRGAPNSIIPAGTYFVAIEGDSAENPGDVQTIINLSGFQFGTNGFLVFLQNGHTYTANPGATTHTSSSAGFGGLPGAVFQADGGATDIEHDSVTFMIVHAETAPSLSHDIDANDDATPDGAAYAGWTVLDSIAGLDGTSATDSGYGALTFVFGSGQTSGTSAVVGFAPIYVGRIGDSTGSTAADWAATGILGGAQPNWTLGSNPEPPGFANKPLNHIGASNFVNLAPVNSVPAAQNVNEDNTLTFNAGNSNLISISDPDAGTAAVKVTLTATNGTFSLSGTSGLSFTIGAGTADTQMEFTGTIADINTALNGLIFTPTLNFFSPPDASLTILTNDQGNAGVGGALSDSDVINITVNAVNDAPSFSIAGNPPAVLEDAGAQTANAFATGMSAGPGETGQTLTFNVVANGTTGNIGFTSAPAIDATTGNLTYTTAADTNGTATFNVTLSDNGGGTNTSAIQSFTITVNAVNDAPSFQIPSNPPAVNEDAGAQTVNTFATSFAPGPVTATDETGQTLVGYTVTQTGTTGNLAFTSGPSIDNAGALTYTPTANTSGTATYNAVATDSGSGTSPNVNQSAAVSFTITVNDQNDAPALDNTGNMSLTAINEDVASGSNTGTLVGDIIASAGGDRITDLDAGALEGIAVTAVNNTNGTWEYSINSGGAWTAFGSPSSSTARLLASNATTRVRFLPNANFNGVINPGITFQAWDQTSGSNGNTGDATVNGGTTAFSTATETASITVNPVNDQPTANGQAQVTDEDTPLAITLTGSDVETASGSLTFTVTVQPTGGVLSGTAPNLTYTPNANFNGADSFKFTVTDTGDGSSPALTSAEATVSITVNPVNDAPVNTLPGAQTTAENTPITFSTANSNAISVADVDAGSNEIQVTLTSGSGTMTLSGTTGLTFTPAGPGNDGTADATLTFNGTISDINAALNGLVFTPSPGFTGGGSIQIFTNDLGNSGNGGVKADNDVLSVTVTEGGTIQFSASTYNVNENGGSATITITRTGGSSGTATVQFNTSNGSADSSDYTTVSQTVTFVDGDTSETVNVPITNDPDNEPTQTVNLTLSSPGGSAALGTPSTAVLNINNDDAVVFNFSQAAYVIAENGLNIDITVTRSGDPAPAVSVDYDTSDLSGLDDCSVANTGFASDRCDYLAALGTIDFAATETSRTFRIFITNDVRVEPLEQLTITLSNPVGGALGATSSATLTITDNDLVAPTSNPIDDNAFFIRMLYVDILAREPDPVGLQSWLDTLNNCPSFNDPSCDRVHVAESFFHSAEFGERGYFIYRFFDAGLGQRPTYKKFLRGLQQIGGNLSPAQSEAAKMEFINDFMASPEFQAIYAGLLTPAQANAFITQLETTSGVTIPEPLRSQLVNNMASGAKTPAETLRGFMESPAIFNGYYNRGFVSMLYFGYLHRDPDTVGFNNWLTQLNATNDFRPLTFGFIHSNEYRGRFGP